MDPTTQAGEEAAKVLDALAVISTEFSCHSKAPPHTLVLSAGKLRETCDVIDEAVRALREILKIAVENSGGPVSESALRKLDDSANE
jgi:hypothetical protein